MGNNSYSEDSLKGGINHTETTRLNLSIEDFLLVAMKHSRAIMFADSNHAVVPERIDSLLSSPRLLAQFSENGYHTYFRETGRQSQPIIDKLASGQSSRQEFAESMLEANGGYIDVPTTYKTELSAKRSYLENSLAPLISQLSNFGIHPISADVELEQYVDEFDYLMNKATPKQIETFERRDMTSESLDDSLNTLRTIIFPEGVIPEYMRLSKDPLVAEHIKKTMADVGSEKVFGIYGAGHSFHKDSIPNNIPGMTTILTMDSMGNYGQMINKFEERSREAARDSRNFPGFVFDTERGIIYSTPNADPELLRKLNDFARDISHGNDLDPQQESRRPEQAAPVVLPQQAF